MAMHLIQSDGGSNGHAPVALFDAHHGQRNWAQTGFSSRERHTNFAGLTEVLCRLGFHCRSTTGEPLGVILPSSQLLVIPPPTGRYDAGRERWRRLKPSLFTGEELGSILDFVHDGGRLLLFGYRFGDSFTQTNLGELCLALGCRLNDDAVIDVRALRKTDPLHLQLDTPAECLPQTWSRVAVGTVHWRPGATFTIQAGATAWPLALSAGGTCLSFDRTLRRISFASLPLAVIGGHGAGRFALFGGPHVFESSPLGLLSLADNARFLRNLLDWLLGDALNDPPTTKPAAPPLLEAGLSWPGQVNGRGEGERTVASVERILRKTGVLKALSRAKWLT